jgi:cell division septation protein DedD
MVITKRGRMKEAMLVLEKTYIDPYIIANSNPDEITNSHNTNDDSLEIKNIGTRFVDAIQSLNIPIKSENTPIKTSPETQSNKNIHIIVGSFSSNENAQALKLQLKKRGFEQAEIIGMNDAGLTRVAVNSFFTEEEAEQELLEIKNKLSSAWILNLN